MDSLKIYNNWLFSDALVLTFPEFPIAIVYYFLLMPVFHFLFLSQCLCRTQKEDALNFRVAKGDEISQLEKVPFLQGNNVTSY